MWRLGKSWRIMANQKDPKKKNTLVMVIYVIGIAVAAGSYIFAEASGYMIPGLSPLSLAAVILTYTWQHYKENRANKDGMLVPQLVILGVLAAWNVISGLMQLYAYFVQL